MHLRIAAASLASLLALSAAPDVVTAPEDKEWRSEHHPVVVRYQPPWTLEASYDRPDRMLAALLQPPIEETARDTKVGHAYMVLVTEDVPDDQVSNKTLIDLNKRKITGKGGWVFIDDAVVPFHGDDYIRLRFRAKGTKGEVCQYLYLRRTGERFISVQCIFPYNEELVEAGKMSPALEELNEDVVLFDESRTDE